MRYIPSKKRIITVGNSNSLTTGFETKSFGKAAGDCDGTILPTFRCVEIIKTPVRAYYISWSL